MSPDLVFAICNYGVIPAWLLLAFAPNWPATQRVVHAAFIPLLLGVVYIGAFILNPDSPEGAGFDSLRGVMAFFTAPYAALAGWVHYLVFDLFVGAWEVRDAKRRGIHHGFVIPCLLFTLMLGPVGLLLYLVIRYAKLRTLTLDEGV